MRQHGACQVELTKDVGAERPLELVVRQVFKALGQVLLGGVVYQNVDTTKCLHHLPGNFACKIRIAYVTWDRQTMASRPPDQVKRLLRVPVFVKIGNGDAGAFLREADRDGPADTGIST